MPDGTSSNLQTPFGAPVLPTFFNTDDQRVGLATLSAWDSIEFAVGYSFHREHGHALKQRKEWFEQVHTWPSSVMWWEDDFEKVDWLMANEKLAELDQNGATASSFNFQSLYNNEGAPTKLDQTRVRDLRSG